MGLSIKSLWSRIGQAAAAATGAHGDEPNPETRREQIVRRQREQAAAAVQSRLSRQQGDEPSEEASQPLYGSSAYSTPPR